MTIQRTQTEHEILGTHIERARQQGITTIEQAGDRAWMYQSALRGIARARYADRTIDPPNNPQEWNATWRLSPEHAAELHEELRLVARRAAMMENFEAYVRNAREGIIDSGLRNYQIEPFESTQAFVSAATRDILVSDEPLLQNLTKGGYLEKPPSFGKTYFMAAVVKAVGAGEAPNEHDNYPIRALVLTPRRKLVRQTIGQPSTTTKVERGFAAAAPDLAVTPYYSGKQDLSGDVVVMTYQSFIGAVRNGMLDKHHFDLILCDEAHRALAPKTMEALNQYRVGRLTIGLTGSPDYDEGRKLEHILPHRIDGSDALTGIHEGYINGFQYWAYRTNSLIEVKSNSRAEFSDAEVYPLIHDAARNALILNIMKRDIESGRRGIVRCVRGGNCLHPRIIEGLAANTLIRDPLTGEMRPMRVVALDYKQDDILDDMIDLLSQPDGPDALTYVGILNEGVDSDAIRFIVDAAPTTSQVVGKQVAGRAYRIDPQGRLTMLSQLFDEVRGRKTRYTFLHAVGVEEFEQGLIVAPQHMEIDQGGHHGYTAQKQDMPLELREALIEDLATFCTEELELRPIYSEVEDDWTSLISLTEQGRSYVSTLGKETVKHMLRRVGFDEPVYAKPEGGWPGYYYKDGAWEKLQEVLAKIKMPPPGWRTLTTIVLETGSNSYRFERFIEANNLTGETYNHPQNLMEFTYYSPAVYEAFQALEGKRITANPDDIEVLKLAREVGVAPATLERFLSQRNMKWQEKATASGHPARFLDADQAKEVRDYFGVVEGSLTISELGHVLGVARTRVATWLQTNGFIIGNKRAIQEKGDAPRLIHYGRRFPPDVIAEAIEALTPDEVQPDWVTLRHYAAEGGRSYTAARRLANDHAIPLRRVRDAKTRSASPVLYLDAEGRARFDAVAPPIEQATPGDRTMSQLKVMTGFSDFKIRSAMTAQELASCIPKTSIMGENIGRPAPHFPASTVSALLHRLGLPVPADVAGETVHTPAVPKPVNLRKADEAAPLTQSPLSNERLATPLETSYENEEWMPVGLLLQEIRCDIKSFWVLLRRCNLASKSSFKVIDGAREALLRPYAVAQIRRLASHIGPAPRNWYSSAAIARHCGVQEQRVIDAIRMITPHEQEVKLYRTNDDQGMITTHYAPRIASTIQQRFTGRTSG